MLQVVQDIRNGTTRVRELPDPIAPPGGVLVANQTSLVSAGTERSVVELARKSLLGKARERPDQVRRVLQKLRQEGVLSTLSQVRAKLEEPMPLGYSTAGVVIECGRAVQEFKPGDRVATAGPHASLVSVGRNLCARIPDDVTFAQAAYTAVAAIGLEGVRLTRVGLGDRVLVIGLGLIGQICVCLFRAQGCRVFGTDLDPARLELARALGADEVATGSPRDQALAFSDGHGVDAVLITAATSSNEPIEFAADACRPKGRIVLVGVAGLNLPRPPFFKKELEFTVSASLGPGRWDPLYEEKGVDYPIGHVRWTAQRNMQAVLETMAAGRLPVDRLTTHRFPIERAEDAYSVITTADRPTALGVLLEYPDLPASPPRRRIDLTSRLASRGGLGISVIGAGNFARLVLMPLLARVRGARWRGLCSAKGMHALHSGERFGFAYATTEASQVFADKDTHAVFVMTRHDLHAEIVEAALRAGKHVFVEKPLCIRPDELRRISDCVETLGERCPVLMIGFNRRFARATARLREAFAGVRPLSVSMRFVTADLPADSWPHDEDVGGGRIVGEACHAVDTCVAIIGSEPVRVYAESVARGSSASDDRAVITVRHRDGSVSCVSYQASGSRSGPKERIEVFGGGKTAVVESWGTVEIWDGERRERHRTGLDRGYSAEVDAFLGAVRNGGPWPIPWAQVHGTTWASFAAVQSLRDGLPVDID